MIKCSVCDLDTTNKLFCSIGCMNKYNLNKMQANCVSCNKTFLKKDSKSKYCSKHCIDNRYFYYVEKYNTFLQPNTNGNGINKSIRKYLIKKYGNNCMLCNLDANNWCDKPITLIVDHIDGDAYNFNVDNIRLVCPNCDSQLPTFKGRNIGKCTRKYYIVQK